VASVAHPVASAALWPSFSSLRTRSHSFRCRLTSACAAVCGCAAAGDGGCAGVADCRKPAADVAVGTGVALVAAPCAPLARLAATPLLACTAPGSLNNAPCLPAAVPPLPDPTLAPLPCTGPALPLCGRAAGAGVCMASIVPRRQSTTAAMLAGRSAALAAQQACMRSVTGCGR
jgi:hypothetical protein